MSTSNQSSRKRITHQSESIKVIVRVRPLLPSRVEGVFRDSDQVVFVNNSNATVSIDASNKQVQCTYDYAFGPESTQNDLYSKVSSCIDSAVLGYNATILAYGQTGTGKTYSMFGPQISTTFKRHRRALQLMSSQYGVIPRSIQHIFEKLSKDEKTGVLSAFSVSTSFIQVYNDQVFDMFGDPERSNPLEIHEDRNNAFSGSEIT
eukprot:3371588-Ditylum_brightwellii.AAC.1